MQLDTGIIESQVLSIPGFLAGLLSQAKLPGSNQILVPAGNNAKGV
jgi:hypothetical protein